VLVIHSHHDSTIGITMVQYEYGSAGTGTSHVLLYFYAISGIVGIRILLSQTFEA
jgi:hypothetical protein